MSRVRRTNPDKLLWPAEGISKRDLLGYLEAVAGLLLDELRGRPLTLVRAPDGIEGFTFYQKQAPDYTPGWIDTVSVPSPASARGDVRYLVCNTAEALEWIGNQAALELHPGLATVPRLDRPDVLMFDLDPPPDRFDLAVAAALALRHALEEASIESVPKTTGGKGVHVVVRIERRLGFDRAQELARAVAETAMRGRPGLMTFEMRKRDRGGRVLVDVGRNTRAATVVAAFSPRARPGAPVSFPVSWGDLERVDPRDLTVRTVPGLLDSPGVRAWRETRRRPQRPAAAAVASGRRRASG